MVILWKHWSGNGLRSSGRCNIWGYATRRVVEQYWLWQSPCCCKNRATQAMGRTFPHSSGRKDKTRQLRAGPVLER